MGKGIFAGLAAALPVIFGLLFGNLEYRLIACMGALLRHFSLERSRRKACNGYIPWRKTNLFHRLYLLNRHANMVFLYILENFSGYHSKFPPELRQTIQEMTISLDKKKKDEKITKKILSLICKGDISELFEKFMMLMP
jgi:hypothetical protein